MGADEVWRKYAKADRYEARLPNMKPSDNASPTMTRAKPTTIAAVKGSPRRMTAQTTVTGAWR